jgi:hypothetical protein
MPDRINQIISDKFSADAGMLLPGVGDPVTFWYRSHKAKELVMPAKELHGVVSGYSYQFCDGVPKYYIIVVLNPDLTSNSQIHTATYYIWAENFNPQTA